MLGIGRPERVVRFEGLGEELAEGMGVFEEFHCVTDGVTAVRIVEDVGWPNDVGGADLH